MEKKDAREDTLESIEEHHVAEVVLKELEKMEKSEERWGAKMSVLKELVEHHIQEEESKIFPISEKVLDHDQMHKILKKFQEDKEKIKKSLS
jgi:hemerythrin-like domain-containing protein